MTLWGDDIWNFVLRPIGTVLYEQYGTGNALILLAYSVCLPYTLVLVSRIESALRIGVQCALIRRE
jgi:hypothetical protein